MGEKKVRSLLKGVAITGASVGGAALLGDADLVYAMEEAAGEIVVNTTPAPAAVEVTAPAPAVEVTAPAPAAVEVAAPAPAAVEVAAPAPAVETPAPVAETPATPVEEVPSTPVAETPATPVEEAPVETPATPVVEAPVAETPATPAEETPAALAEDTNDDVFTILRGAYRDESIDENELAENKIELKAMRKAAPLATESTNDAENDAETDASLSDTAEVATVYTEEQISESGASLSTVESELSSTSEKLSTSASEAESQYESYSETMTTTSEDYSSKNYNIAKLDKLEQDVKAAQAIETAKREALAAKNKSLDTDYFEHAGRPLAITMIKYNLVIDGKADPNYIDSAQIKYYTPDGYDKKHFCTIYLGTDGQVHEEYYDYVTANARGESLFRWSELSEEDVAANITIPRNISIENYSPYVSGINIVEKFLQDNGIRENGKLFSYTFTGDDGTIKTFKITRQSYSMEADENGHYKGKDYYGYAFMNSQMDERSELASEMLSLSAAIASTGSQVEGYQSMVDEYVARSNELDSAWSQYAANSTKTAESLSNSTSTSESAASTAASQQASTVASQEASTAASTSASASESAAVAATVSAPVASASTAAPAASAQTVMPAAGAIANQAITPIDDARVPLGVVNDDAVGGEEVTGGRELIVEGRTIEAVNEAETEVTEIADDDVAKGITVTEDESLARKGFWWWIIALITGKVTYDKVKKEKEKEKENN
ncbi:hypothetical protein [Pseudobutyrivibrio ruminis]|uniref:Uncharacterized protein n=1 Tax=Pseudobutyrivibrio ruminis DSM 9787 TaxID=1123011 RepID=A0A285RRW6_9FIRM|nr:hypothetical protein [Pseudobutyrivibrio ruminis]SOB96449.1 hypothetical protein SAMN02910411_1077 [Pseudobutyrivibrio ruminis DSM 9787]